MQTLQAQVLARRELLRSAGYGIGLAALRTLLAEDRVLQATEANTASAASNPLAVKPSHFEPKAKSCIFIFLEGGPSQIDLWDPKPTLNKMHGEPLPESLTKDVRFAFIKKETARLQVRQH